jgi:hypothetical protein
MEQKNEAIFDEKIPGKYHSNEIIHEERNTGCHLTFAPITKGDVEKMNGNVTIK